MSMSDGIAYYGNLRRFFENEWYIPVSVFGITYWEFWDLNPRILRIRSIASQKAMVLRDRELWQQGQYIYVAFASVLGAAFSKKGHATQKYPDKPYLHDYGMSMEDPERNERLAMLEMDRYIAALSKQGMAKSKISRESGEDQSTEQAN